MIYLAQQHHHTAIGDAFRHTTLICRDAEGRCLMGATAGLGPRELMSLKQPQGANCRLELGQIHWIGYSND
jgi:hypothetical protein